jgi:WD40 repeat protein
MHLRWLHPSSEKKIRLPIELLPTPNVDFPALDEAVVVSIEKKWVFSKLVTIGDFALFDLQNLTLIRKFVGHFDAITCLAITADSQKVVSGSLDKTIRIWEIATGRCLHVCKAGEIISCLAITPDGSQIISGGYYDTLTLWDITTGKSLGSLENPVYKNSKLNWLSIMPNGYIILKTEPSELQGKTLFLIWAVEETWYRQATRYMQIASQIGFNLLTAVGAGTSFRGLFNNLIPTNLTRAKPFCALYSLEGSAPIYKFVLSSNGKYIIVVRESNKKRMEIWEMEDLEGIKEREGVFWHFMKPIRHIDDEKDILSLTAIAGNLVITGYMGASIKTWDIHTGGYVGVSKWAVLCSSYRYVPGRSISAKLTQHDIRVNSFSVAFSEDTAISLDYAHDAILVWKKVVKNTLSWDAIELISNGSAPHLKYCKYRTLDGKKLIAIDASHKPIIWDNETERFNLASAAHQHLPFPTEKVDCWITTNGQKIIILSKNEKIAKIWDIGNGQLLHVLSGIEWHDRFFTITAAEEYEGEYWVSIGKNISSSAIRWDIETGQRSDWGADHYINSQEGLLSREEVHPYHCFIVADNMYIITVNKGLNSAYRDTIRVLQRSSPQYIERKVNYMLDYLCTVTSLVMTPDQKYIIFTSVNSSNGERSISLLEWHTAHKWVCRMEIKDINAHKVELTPEGDLLITRRNLFSEIIIRKKILDIAMSPMSMADRNYLKRELFPEWIIKGIEEDRFPLNTHGPSSLLSLCVDTMKKTPAKLPLSKYTVECIVYHYS